MKEDLGKKMLTVTLSPSSQDFSELVKKETQGWGESCARRTSRYE